jgi:hypothetical protein
MTDEEKKAFGEKMAALRLAKKTHPIVTVNPPITPQPVVTESDLAAKMAQLEAALLKTNELNAKIEAQEKIRSEAFVSGKTISPEEQQSVIEAHKSDADKMKANLAAQPKVRIYVPLEGKEKMGTQLPVTVNGYRVNIPKGVYVDVPEQIADIVTYSLNQTQQAIESSKRLDRLDEKGQEILA